MPTFKPTPTYNCVRHHHLAAPTQPVALGGSGIGIGKSSAAASCIAADTTLYVIHHLGTVTSAKRTNSLPLTNRCACRRERQERSPVPVLSCHTPTPQRVLVSACNFATYGHHTIVVIWISPWWYYWHRSQHMHAFRCMQRTQSCMLLHSISRVVATKQVR
jgi:hypothetical protein